MRTTFISSDGSKEKRTSPCEVTFINDNEKFPQVYIPDTEVPDWVQKGDEIVTAENGKVITAFTIRKIRYYGVLPNVSNPPYSWNEQTKLFSSTQQRG